MNLFKNYIFTGCIFLILLLTFFFTKHSFAQEPSTSKNRIVRAINDNDLDLVKSLCNEDSTLDDYEKQVCLKLDSDLAFKAGDLKKATNIFSKIFQLQHFDTLLRLDDYYKYLDLLSKSENDDTDSIFHILGQAKELTQSYSKRGISNTVALQSNYAKYYTLSGQYGRSAEINKLIEYSFENENTVNVARIGNLINLGSVYLETNIPKVAEEYYKKALKLASERDDIPPNYLPAIHYSLGRVYQLNHEYEDSETSFEQSKDGFAAMFGTRDHPALVSCQSYNTENLIMKGFVKEGIDNALDVLDKNKFVYPCPSSETMANYIELAKAYSAHSEFDKALIANSMGFECMGIPQDSIIEVFVTDQKYDLLKAYAQRIFILTKLKVDKRIIELNITVGEELIKSLLSNTYDQSEVRDLSGTVSFREFIEACLNYHYSYAANINHDTDFFRALSWTELVKPRIANSNKDNESDLQGPMLEITQLSNTIAELELSLFYSLQENADLTKGITIREDLNKSKGKYNNLITTLKNNYPDFYQYKFSKNDLSIIKNKLKDSESIMSYFVGAKFIYIFTISNAGQNITRIARDFKLEKDFSNNQKEISNANLNLTTKLTDYLINGDIRSAINKSEHLTIIGDLWINNCPFEALPIDSNRLLIHNFAVSYSPSIHYALSENRIYKSATNFIAFAPEFKTEGIEIAYLSQMRMISENEYKPLTYSLSEVDLISNLFKVTKFVKNDATKHEFINHMQSADIIHLSTHGKADPIDNDNNVLVFSPTVENHLFYSKELSDKRLQAQMVVLSACETSLGVVHSGEGTLSLAKDFMKAGAASVISTLWSVNDKSTSQIMGYFYQNLKTGMRKDDALRHAKLSYLDANPDLGINPYFWAGIVANGDMEPIHFEKSRFHYLLLLLGVISLFGYFFYKRRVLKLKA